MLILLLPYHKEQVSHFRKVRRRRTFLCTPLDFRQRWPIVIKQELSDRADVHQVMGLRLVPGVTSTLAMFPLETVRTRLAVDHKTYRNVFTAFRLIFGQEGVPAFYRVGTVHLLPPSSCFVLSRTFAVSVSKSSLLSGLQACCQSYLVGCRVLARVYWV